YFSYLKEASHITIPEKNIKGWSTWYYYYNKISPEIIYKNLETFKNKKIHFDFIQIDDGYETAVGDWLSLKPNFQGRMKELSDAIREAGFKPGIWIAPFITAIRSELAKNRPDFLLRTEYGKPIIAGWSPDWHGKFFYALDLTNPRVEEYVYNVVKTIVHDWGYEYLKLDFLYGGCMRGGNHIKSYLSRTEVLKHGMSIIREAAGKDVVFTGCGMPISTGIGNINAMRVGPDTAPLWKKMVGNFLQTGAMLGARNSIRNFVVRSFFHKKLWLNDPDCLMIRKSDTRLSEEERMTQINAIILSGGMLMFSDDFSTLSEDILQEVDKIIQLNEICFTGEALPLDVMVNEIPQIYYNTAGYIGVFNYKSKKRDIEVNLEQYSFFIDPIERLKEVWIGMEIELKGKYHFTINNLKPHASCLFKMDFLKK
ncbi:MAG: alpha-galactosidase, partial [Spirochaetes bacterium]|nr:alpha-galactosidase [Spirochaetota bacterium]